MTKKRAPPCLFCGKPSTLLCDYVLGRDASEAHVRRRLEDPYHTCDAPMCPACSKTVGHICGAAMRDCDTFDLCPVHALEGLGDMLRVVEKSDVDAYRRRLELAIRNGIPPSKLSTRIEGT